MPIQVLRPRIAFATALMWTGKILLETLPASLPLSRLTLCVINPAFLLITALIFCLGSNTPIPMFPATS